MRSPTAHGVHRVSRMQLRSVLALAALFSVAACGEDSQGDPPPDEPPPIEATYHQTIKPILDAKCVGCHSEGGIGPFALDTFAAAGEYASAIAQAVSTKVMPPWPANKDCREYVGDRSLDDAQIAAVAAWVQAGAPEGDPARPGAPLPNDLPSLSRVDATLAMPEAYTAAPPAGEHDDYRCFVLPWPAEFAQRSFVTGFRAVPGNDQVVHHVIAFLAGPADVATFQKMDADEPGAGYTCFGGAGGPVAGMIGGWAPGSLGSDLPPGIGLPVEPGSAIILQVHYNTDHGAGADLSSIELKVDGSVEREGRVVPFANPSWTRGNMPIAAGDANATHAFSFDPTLFLGDVEVFSAALHMHTLGVSGRLQVDRASGSSCMLQIDDWDFHWQGSYGFRQSEIVRRGDQVSIECHWDNSPANQHDGGAPKNVNWGEGTGDEMCVGFFLTAPAP